MHKEALSYLRYGIESHAGFVVITGEIGSGKTTLLQTMIRGLDGRTTVARVMNTLLDPRELLEAAMIDFGLDPGRHVEAGDCCKTFGEFLVNERAGGRLVLLVIDEAQNLSAAGARGNPDAVEPRDREVEAAADHPDRPARTCATSWLAPSSSSCGSGSRSAITCEPLDAEETGALHQSPAGARRRSARRWSSRASVTDLIHERSGGVPRMINVIADATLLFGYGEERSEIDAALIEEVIADLDATGVLGPRSNANRHESVVPADPAMAAAMAGGGAAAGPQAVSRPTAEDQKLARELAAREAGAASARGRHGEPRARARRAAPGARRTVPAPEGAAATVTARRPPRARPCGRRRRSERRKPRRTPRRRRARTPTRPDFALYQPKRRAGFWRRFRNTLLGNAVLEDSL